ncbi:MAG: DUF2062 domain-containing protein [Nitrospiraceae bacterium]|nr:MAG: DUF2062 domain-containing protein [Nitrospiraceae bacterium]
MAYFRDKFRGIFQVKDTPHRIALAFSVGVLLGISPLIGFHFIGAFFLAWLFRLNKLITLIGASVNNPWTVVPISSFNVLVGAKLLGIKKVLPDIDWGSVTLSGVISRFTDIDNFISTLKKLAPLLTAFLVGSFIICVVSAVASYFIIHALTKKYRNIKHAE